MEGLIFGILRYFRNFNRTKYTWKSRELQRHTRQCILGYPGADSGGEGKSKRAGKKYLLLSPITVKSHV